MRSTLLLLLGCSLVSAPTLAQAQPAPGGGARPHPTAAIQPAIGGHQQIAPRHQTVARTAATELMRTEGFLVIDDARAHSLSNREQECPPGAECSEEVRNALGVEVLLGITIWGSTETPDVPTSVRVVLLTSQGNTYQAEAEVQEGDVQSATHDATRNAITELRSGDQGPYIHVTGTEGAVIEIDGAARGTIPARLSAPPGPHEVFISLDGYQSQRLDVELPTDTAAVEELQVHLIGGGNGGGGGGGGGALVGIGVGLLVGGAAAAVLPWVASEANSGCDTTACTTATDIDEAAVLTWAVIGGVAALTGITLIAIGIASGGDDNDSTAQLRIHPTGLSLEGSF